MAKKGIKIIRLYIFPNNDIYEHPEITGHLDFLSENNIEVRVIVMGEQPLSRKHVELLNSDFVIFGEKKVGIGQLGTENGIDNVVVKSDICISQDLVKDYLNKFKLLCDISRIYEKSATLEQISRTDSHGNDPCPPKDKN